MAQMTIEKFATDLKMPAGALLEQLLEADGVPRHSIPIAGTDRRSTIPIATASPCSSATMPAAAMRHW